MLGASARRQDTFPLGKPEQELASLLVGTTIIGNNARFLQKGDAPHQSMESALRQELEVRARALLETCARRPSNHGCSRTAFCSPVLPSSPSPVPPDVGQACARQSYERLKALVEPPVPALEYDAASRLAPAALQQLVVRVRELVDNDRWAFAPVFKP